MNLQQSERLIDDIRRFYILEIHKAADRAGGIEKLSVRLGYSNLYLFKLLKRDSFSALRRMVKKINE